MIFTISSAVVMILSSMPDDKDKLNQLIMLHKSARESITFLHCSVMQETTEKDSPLNLNAIFWKGIQGYRLQVTRSPKGQYPDISTDSSFIGGHFQQLVRRKKGVGDETVLLKLNKRSFQDFGNPWFFGLLTFIGIGEKGIGPYTLEELLENKDLSIDYINEERTLESDGFTLKLRHKNGYFLITFDEKYNYLVRQVIYSIKNDKARSIHNVKKFVQVAPGIYFPVIIELTNEVDGQIKEKVLTTINIISANKPINDEALSFHVPNGIRCFDAIKNESYQVDSNGNRVGPLLDQKGKPITTTSTPPFSDISSARDQIPADYSNVNGQTKGETYNWLLWASIATILTILILLIYMRYKRSN
jgi:hypothetical protein